MSNPSPSPNPSSFKPGFPIPKVPVIPVVAPASGGEPDTAKEVGPFFTMVPTGNGSKYNVVEAWLNGKSVSRWYIRNVLNEDKKAVPMTKGAAWDQLRRLITEQLYFGRIPAKEG